MVKRGELYVCAPPGEYGKPRPVLVIQSDLFNEVRDSVTICLLTGKLIDAPLFRVRIQSGAENSLKKPSDVMTDKIMTVHSDRLRDPLGRVSAEESAAVDAAISRWLGLGE